VPVCGGERLSGARALCTAKGVTTAENREAEQAGVWDAGVLPPAHARAQTHTFLTRSRCIVSRCKEGRARRKSFVARSCEPGVAESGGGGTPCGCTLQARARALQPATPPAQPPGGPHSHRPSASPQLHSSLPPAGTDDRSYIAAGRAGLAEVLNAPAVRGGRTASACAALSASGSSSCVAASTWAWRAWAVRACVRACVDAPIACAELMACAGLGTRC
jgi:hypothetical protein